MHPQKNIKADHETEPTKKTTFNSIWMYHNDSEESFSMEIKDDATFLTTEDTQQYVICRNVLKDDTLFLYIVATDTADCLKNTSFENQSISINYRCETFNYSNQKTLYPV